MIRFHDVWKTFRLKRGGRKHILRGVSLQLPTDRRIALIGRNGAGKSTMLNMISGNIRPDSGEITATGRVSWPMGFAAAFHPALTGRQNARFVARIYGADTESMENYVEDFAELGDFLDAPIRSYSSGMKARLAFGISMAAEFDCYLVDEITAVGDALFRQKCKQVFSEKLKDAQVIMVSHSDATLRDYCDSALLLENGQLQYFDDLEAGLKAYKTLIAA